MKHLGANYSVREHASTRCHVLLLMPRICHQSFVVASLISSLGVSTKLTSGLYEHFTPPGGGKRRSVRVLDAVLIALLHSGNTCIGTSCFRYTFLIIAGMKDVCSAFAVKLS
jgi:hypothetical protein